MNAERETSPVAREAELAVVRAFVDRPIDRLRALVLEGEAGIGKSTLWREGVEAARRRTLRVLVSRPAESEAMLPHVVLGDLLGEAAPMILDELPTPRRLALAAALRLVEPGPGPTDPLTLHAAVATAFSVLARGGPLVIAIDDEHWTDTSSRVALAFALRRLPDASIALLLATRPREPGMAAGLEDALAAERVERISVGPLSAGAMQLLLSRRTGVTLSRPAFRRLHDTARGNPFVALELARANAVRPLGDGPSPPELPAALRPLLAGRLASIEPSMRHLLLLVAAHGRLEPHLREALGVTDPELERAIAAGLLELADDTVRFTHPLLAAAVYRQGGSEERRRAHADLAELVDDPLQQARHRALATTGSNEAVAASVELAAAQARIRGLPVAAAELAEQAVRLTPVRSVDDLARRALLAARAHLEAGDPSRARSILDRELATASSGAIRAESLVLASELEEPGPAVAILEEALAAATEAPAVEAIIHVQLADVGRFVTGREPAELHARAALQLADGLADDSLRSRALATLATLRFEASDPTALDIAFEAHRRAVTLADPEAIRTSTATVGHQLMWLRRNDEARRWLERALADLGERDEVLRGECLWYLALVELWSGHWESAWMHAEASREIHAQYGIEQPQDHMPQALIALHRGDFESARDYSMHAVALADGMLLPTHTAILGVAELWSGRPEAALGHLEAAQELAARRGVPDPRFWVGRADYVETLLQLGRAADARRFLAEWEATARGTNHDWVAAELLRARGLIAAGAGELAAAARLFDEAAASHERADDPFGRGRDLLALGAVRRRQRQKRLARLALEAAQTAFEALGAASFASVARVELARLGGRRRAEGLSPSERRVAELVVEGRTNREIAAALFLGERTVASHLTHVYAKLGIRSRTELARHLSQVPPVNVPRF